VSVGFLAIGVCPATALDIVANYDPLWSFPPEMQAAIDSAAGAWEARLTDPVTVPLWFTRSYLVAENGGNTKAEWITTDFDNLRGALIADAAAYESPLVTTLPDYATIAAYVDWPIGTKENRLATPWMTSANARALGFSSPYPNDAQIHLSANQTDFGPVFVSIVEHEIGHALGFCSVVDHVDGLPRPPPNAATPMDLFRLRKGEKVSYGFTYAPRVLVPGNYVTVDGKTMTEQVLWDGERELDMSTGQVNGNGCQAAHYVPPSIEEDLGIMIPSNAYRATAHDLKVLSLIGWDVAGWDGETMHWQGTGSGGSSIMWSDTEGWSPQVIPHEGYDVYVYQSAEGIIVLDNHWYGTLDRLAPFACGDLHLDGDPALGNTGLVVTDNGSLKADSVYIAETGRSTITHDGQNARLKIAGNLVMGRYVGSHGSYELRSGGGTLEVGGDVTVGLEGTGEFVQSGGTSTIAGTLHMGSGSGSYGTYHLLGGSLAVQTVAVGVAGTGTFTWTGGSLDADTITVGPQGTMTVGQNWTYDGVLNINGGTVDLGTHVLTINNSGTVNLRSGQLRTGASGVSGDNRGEVIGLGDSGRVIQSGGTNHVVGRLYIGRDAGANGEYQMDGGLLELGSSGGGMIIGTDAGIGAFAQNNGTVRLLEERLELGDIGATSQGTYTLSGGTLEVGAHVYVGVSGTGRFIQSGGTHEVRGVSDSAVLALGYSAGGSGTYELSGSGQVTAQHECVGGGGKGEFVQSGGSNTVLNDLVLGRDPGSDGTYELNAPGTVSCARLYVGMSGTGTYIQNGGTTTVTGNCDLGWGAGAAGTYRLSGGTLSVGGVVNVGKGGTQRR
jgi:hypothetical protein